MNTLYKPVPRVAVQNVSLFLGEDQGMNIDASLSHAIELLKSQPYGSILYLNTVQTPRSMYHSARSHGLDPASTGQCEVDGDQHKLIHIINIERGELHKSREWIDYLLAEDHVHYVIVNSWEFAARSSRYRQGEEIGARHD